MSLRRTKTPRKAARLPTAEVVDVRRGMFGYPAPVTLRLRTARRRPSLAAAPALRRSRRYRRPAGLRHCGHERVEFEDAVEKVVVYR